MEILGIFGAMSALLAAWNYRPFSERCDSKWIVNDFTGLYKDFESKLYGQHLASSIVWKALVQHMKNDNPRKALVLSFHGRTGSGKNHVANLTAHRIFKLGSKSSFYKLWVAKKDFLHERRTEEYKDNLQEDITLMVKNCPRSVFVFDEADAMPSGVIDAIKPFLDYYDELGGVDYRKATFIFLSNTGSNSIAKVAFEFWQKNNRREDIEMKDIEPLIKAKSFNERGGLQESHLTKNSLIDFYVPFFPLEKKHVKSCIEDYLLERGVEDIGKRNELVNEVADSMEFEPPDFYSKTGCKTIEGRVNVLL